MVPTYEKDIITWVNEAVSEGYSFLEAQYGYDKIDQAIRYIQGDQTSPKPSYQANFSSNRLRKIVNDYVATLTDIKPFFSYRTQNDMFQHQAMILNKLATSWWLNTFADLKLGMSIELAAPAGCSYIQMVYNNSLGDVDLIPRDCRDVIPIRAANTLSIQDALGVVILSLETVNFLRGKYPHKSSEINADRDIAFYQPPTTGYGRLVNRILSPVQKTIFRRKRPEQYRIPGVEVRTVYLKDDSTNDTEGVITMGGGPNGDRYTWTYDVAPGEPLYPRGRCIVCTQNVVLYDGPNIYWHGKFPLIKIPMDLSFVLPNSYFSSSIVGDLIQHQDLINDVLNGITDAVRKALEPGVVADQRTVPKSVLENIRTRRPGMRLSVNATGIPLQFTDAPNLPNYVFDFLKFLIEDTEYLSGVHDLTSLAKARQLPSAESVEAIVQAMTPANRLRSRILEAVMREMADMLKFNFFQFYDARRRIAVLGEAGMDFEDFDFDPGTLVPDSDGVLLRPDGARIDLSQEMGNLPKIERATKHAKNFTFYVMPNSMLELSLIGRKLLYLQLRRMGEIDWQTFMEFMEIPNIPQIQERLNSELDQKLAAVMQATAGTPGQKPTAQKSPQLEVKGDGRPVVSES